ncbi:hypothetical protein HJFPF1_11383 [Paramyrothecium foliicola]|nr:hypothetical protein HJFPF1_11383 [Paramyrothecium foliicola]
MPSLGLAQGTYRTDTKNDEPTQCFLHAESTMWNLVIPGWTLLLLGLELLGPIASNVIRTQAQFKRKG